VSETAPGANPYKIYWITWGILLVITVAMLAAEAFHFPRLFLVLFLVAFMMVKAAMIGGNFMHLRFERRNLALMVSSGILVTSLILYLFITPESWHVKKASAIDPATPSGAPAGETAPAAEPAH
jgi:cytochrome c oxidase subunit IV